MARSLKIGRWVSLVLAPLSVAVALAGISPARAEGGGTEVRLEPAEAAVRAGGGSFQVAVVVDGVNHHFIDRGEASDGLGVFEFTLRFNPYVVRIAGMEEGPFMASTGRKVACDGRTPIEDPSIFEFYCTSSGAPAGPQGAGQLARLILEPVASSRASTDLLLEGEMGGPLGSDDIAFKWTGGRVLVAGPTKPLPAPTGSPLPRGRSTAVASGSLDPSAAAGPAGSSSAAGAARAGATGLDADSSGRAGFPVAGHGTPIHEMPSLLLALAGSLALGGVTLVLAGGRSGRRATRQ